MSIPSSQIDTWLKQGPVASSSTTYQSVRNALRHEDSPIAERIANGSILIDLQGSYAHDTNIYGDSDVDVIVHHTGAFHSNKRMLPTDQYDIHERTYFDATYSWKSFRDDVIEALQGYYGDDFVNLSGNKSIKVLPNGGRLRADVVPVISYRKYDYFYGSESHLHSREDGVAFYHRTTGAAIVNYPQQHYDNAVEKHRLTSQRYKGLVRVFKNMRSYLVDKGILEKADAPSYFLQGMVYNVPENLFSADMSATTLAALRFLRNANLTSFVSQNKLHPLLGYSEDLWNPDAAQRTVMALCNLWDNWYTT